MGNQSAKCGKWEILTVFGSKHASCFDRACGNLTIVRFIPGNVFQLVEPDKPGVAASASATACAAAAATAETGSIP